VVLDFQELTDRLERAYSRRLALRPVSLADAWPLFQATRNPLFNKHLLWERPDHENEVLARVDAIVQASRSGQMAAVSGVVKTTGEWTSLFRFQPYGNEPGTMEMGVWMHDRFWHGRYSLELGRLCVNAAFGSCDVQRLVGQSVPENRGSRHLMRSVGMSDGKLLTRHTESGSPVLAQEFELSRSEWMLQEQAAAGSSFYASIPSRATPAEVHERRLPRDHSAERAAASA